MLRALLSRRSCFVTRNWRMAHSNKASNDKSYQDLTAPLLAGKLLPEDLSGWDANQLIQHVTKKNQPEKAFAIYDMFKNLHSIQPWTYRSLFLISGNCDGKTRQLMKDLKERDIEVTDTILGGMLVSLTNQNETKRAVQIFEKLLKHYGTIRPFECSVLLHHLIKIEQPEVARELYSRSNVDEPNLLWFDKFIKACLQTHLFEEIQYWYKEMIRASNTRKILLDNQTTEIVITACATKERQDIAYQLIDEMEKHQMIGAQVYESLFRAIIQDKSLEINEKIAKGKLYFDRFVKSGISLGKNSTLLEHVLDLYMTSNDPTDAKEFLEILHSQNFEIHASMVYRISDKYAKESELSLLICQLLEKVKNKGSPAVRSLVYYKLMGLCCGQGNMVKAMTYLGDMETSRLVPSSAIYSQLLQGCCTHHSITDLLALHKKSRSSGVGLSRPLYTMMIDTLLQNHQEQEIPSFVKEATLSSHRIDLGDFARQQIDDAIRESYAHLPEISEIPRRTSPHTEECFQLLQSFILSCLQSDLEQAASFIDTFRSKGIQLPELLYSYLIRFHAKSNQMDKANHFFQERLASHPTSSLYEAMIDVSSSSDPAISLKLYEEMKAKGLHPTLPIYNAVLHSLLSSDDLKHTGDMENILAEMAEKGVTADETTYFSLVKGLCITGSIDKAKEFVYTQGDLLRKSSDILALLVRSYCKAGEPKEAFDFVLEQPTISPSLVRPITDLLLQEKRESELREVVRQLEERNLNNADIRNCFTTFLDSNHYIRSARQ